MRELPCPCPGSTRAAVESMEDSMTTGLLRHDQIPETALAWHRAGRGAALATVTETWGSAPRPAGAMLAVSGGLEIAGSVSGGCVEGAVAEAAIEAIADGSARSLRFGVSSEEAFAVGLACGGNIRVLVEPVGSAEGIPGALLKELVCSRASRMAVVLATAEGGGAHRLLRPGEEGEFGGLADEALRNDRSGTVAVAGERWFLAVHNPPLRLAIVGGSHIAQPLAGMARLAGYEVSIIDPREAFASAARFPDMDLSHDWPDDALRKHGLDARVAVATLTHDPKLDDAGILETLKSDAFYLGCLGSPRTHAKRLDRLRADGVSEAQIARIHAPVGLDIGARSPAEIAVAILAEITAALRGGPRRKPASP